MEQRGHLDAVIPLSPRVSLRQSLRWPHFPQGAPLALQFLNVPGEVHVERDPGCEHRGASPQLGALVGSAQREKIGGAAKSHLGNHLLDELDPLLAVQGHFLPKGETILQLEELTGPLADALAQTAVFPGQFPQGHAHGLIEGLRGNVGHVCAATVALLGHPGL